jgi:hypothetical protein
MVEGFADKLGASGSRGFSVFGAEMFPVPSAVLVGGGSRRAVSGGTLSVFGAGTTAGGSGPRLSSA